VPLLRQRPQGLGEERQLVHLERKLARARADQHAGGADDVAEIQVVEHPLAGFAETVAADEELQLQLAVVDVEERALAVLADGAHPAGHAQPHRGRLQLLGRPVAVGHADAERLEVPLEAVRIRRDPRRRQALALLAPILDLLVELGHRNSPSTLPRAGGIAYPRRVRGLKEDARAALRVVYGVTLGRAGAPLAFTIVVTAVPVAVVGVVARPAGLVALELVRAEVSRAALPAAPGRDPVAGDVPDLTPTSSCRRQPSNCCCPGSSRCRRMRSWLRRYTETSVLHCRWAGAWRPAPARRRPGQRPRRHGPRRSSPARPAASPPPSQGR